MTKKRIKIISVVGARPNFMKIAPIAKAFNKQKNILHLIVHTGQHYDEKMSKVFFSDLEIPKPHVNLGVKKSSHAAQTAEIMSRFEKVLLREKPDCVLVVGDVNSTIACSLTAVKLGIKVAHVESGLRSFDRSMPEEVNRVLTDQISDYLFVTEKSGVQNLLNEGVSKKKIFLVGNTMIDTLFVNTKKASRSVILKKLGLKKKGYVLLTLHRPSNVDDPEQLQQMVQAVLKGAEGVDVVFPAHPRTKKQLGPLKAYGLQLKAIPPQGYLDFLKLMSESRVVVTDSGGIQEETSALGIPCLTLRMNTERPVTIEKGTNILVGVNPKKIRNSIRDVLGQKRPAIRNIPLWDGKAAQRIVTILCKDLVA